MLQKFTSLMLRPNRRECVPCPTLNDVVNVNGDCETCPEGSFPNGDRTSCFLCKADEIIFYDDSCKRCPDGLIPNANRKFCVSCPKSLIADGGMCKSCPNPTTE